jgi:meso-butanediol dehydrogenase/(S,S)-butanediol dehydrogenase/diacetyl reductase
VSAGVPDPPPGRVAGKVALVTGGASGIGAAVVQRLAEEGAAVVIADLQADKGEALAEALGAKGRRVAFRTCDVADLAALEDTVAFACAEFGGLDVLHNNAAWSGGGYVADIDPEVWRKSLAVMLDGVFYGCKAAIPAMLERGGGSIVNTSSVEGLFAEMLSAPYSAAKAAVLNLTRSVAIEYGHKNIRANAICPGAVDTPLLDLVVEVGRHTRDEIAAQHALGRVIEPREIANLVLFLASDESSAITGAPIVIDGGLTAGTRLTGFPAFGGGTYG